MKKSRVFIGVAMVAFTLLSCDDIGFNISIADKGGRTEQPPYEHYPVMIADDVQKWMDEQLASKGNEKRPIGIHDMYVPTNDPKAPKDSPCRRNLDIPGEIRSSPENCISWMVLMTAEDLAELLSKKYDDLAISFEPEYQEL